MKAIRNLIHAAVLGGWALMGLIFTLRVLFGSDAAMGNLLTAASWWLWFGGLVALTTALVRRFDGWAGALGVHALLFLVLAAIPRLFPLTLVRLGLDLIKGA